MRFSLVVAMAIGCSVCSFPGRSLAAQWPDLSGPGANAVGGGEKDAAVVVGVERYAYVAPVPGAEGNAKDWYGYFTKTLKVPTDRVALLRNEKGVPEKIRKEAARAAAEVEPGGTLWFVFIGHGVAAKDGSDGMLVGADAQQDTDLIYSRSLGQKELLGILGKGKQARTVVLLDSCFSGRTPEGKPLVEGLQPLVALANPAAVDARTVVLTAARSDQFAGALPGASRPAFSYLSLGGLRGWADENKDGKITARELASYVRKALSTLVRDRSQEPELLSQDASAALGAGREAGPDLADFTLEQKSTAIEFKVSALSEVPQVQIPGALGKAEGIDLGSLNVDALEKYDEAVKFEKGKASPGEKAAKWRELAAKFPQYAGLAETRAKEWERYAEGLKAAEEARVKKLELRDNDWAKLKRLLALSVVSDSDKRQYAKAFVTAYGKTFKDNPYVGELLPYLPTGTISPADRAAFDKAKAAEAAAIEAVRARAGAAQSSLSGKDDMALIPGGEYLMDPKGGFGPDSQERRKVTLAEYYLDKTEVTVGQFRRWGRHSSLLDIQPVGSTDKHPLVFAAWGDADDYCKAQGKRLPTEAEWERAAKAGSDAPLGDESEDALSDRAWLYRNSGRHSHEVGKKRPDAFGLYDMVGNVREWVADGADCSQSECRVVRGGSWSGFTSRAIKGPQGNDETGFRCARESGKAKAEVPGDTGGAPVGASPSAVPVPNDMALIPAGEFWMGSPDGAGKPDEHPRHEVYLDAFYMDKYEVTVAQYRKFSGASGHSMPKRGQNYKSTESHPVANADWDDADAYCKWAGKHLPTEAEWEKAARGGTGTRYFFGDDGSQLNEYAWFSDRQSGETHPPGQKKPNQFGLYDMAGNMSEWVADWYSESYFSASPGKNPQGPSDGEFRSIRGGSFIDDADSLRHAERGRGEPDEGDANLGFRCARGAAK